MWPLYACVIASLIKKAVTSVHYQVVLVWLWTCLLLWVQPAPFCAVLICGRSWSEDGLMSGARVWSAEGVEVSRLCVSHKECSKLPPALLAWAR